MSRSRASCRRSWTRARSTRRRRSRSWRRTSAIASSRRASGRPSASRRPRSRACRCSSTILTGWPPSPIAISRRRFSPMASGKRASMREGPLADLFRKTEQAAEKADEKAPPTAPDEAGVPAPSTPAAQERRAPEPPPPHPRETGYPHPSLGTTEDAPPTPEPRVPTPQERLRHAFSADIPENILDRQPAPPQRDPYASRAADEPTWGTARPVGHPVL